MARHQHPPLHHRLLKQITHHPARLLEAFLVFWIGVILFRTVWNFGGMIWLGFPIQQTAWMLMVLVGVHAFTLVLRHDTVKLRLAALLPVPFLIYAAWKGIYATPAPWMGTLYIWLWLEAYVIFWVVLHMQRTPTHVVALWVTSLVVALLAICAATYQYYFYDAWFLGRIVRIADPDRASGFFVHADHFALFCAIMLPFLMIGAWMRRFSGPVRILFGFLSLAVVNNLFIAGGRSGYLILLICVLLVPVLALHRWKYRLRAFSWLLPATALVVAGVLWLGDGVADRLAATFQASGDREWSGSSEAAMRMVSENPLGGGGIGALGWQWEELRPENSGPLQLGWANSGWYGLMAEAGIIGLLLLVLPMTFFLLRLWDAWRSQPYEKSDAATMARDPSIRPRHRRRHGQKRAPTPIAKVLLSAGLLTVTGLLVAMVYDDPLRVPALIFLAATIGGAIAWLVPVGEFAFSSERLTRWAMILIPLMLAAWVFRGVPVTAGSQWLVLRSGSIMEHQTRQPERMLDNSSIIVEAVANLEIALKLNPRHAEGWITLARARLAMQHTELFDRRILAESARQALRNAAEIAPDHWRIHYTHAEALELEKGFVPEMEPHLLKARALAPHRVEPITMLAWQRYRVHGDVEGARKLIEEALALDPGYAPALRYQSALLL